MAVFMYVLPRLKHVRLVVKCRLDDSRHITELKVSRLLICILLTGYGFVAMSFPNLNQQLVTCKFNHICFIPLFPYSICNIYLYNIHPSMYYRYMKLTKTVFPEEEKKMYI